MNFFINGTNDVINKNKPTLLFKANRYGTPL